MDVFRNYLAEAAAKGEAVNVLFEERLYELSNIVHRITQPLMDAGVPYELVGGLAVLIYLEEADPSQTMLTRDVDVMIGRADLEKVKELARRSDFRFRHTAGLDMLISGLHPKARNAVHLVFSGERVRPDQAAPNPEIRPKRKSLQGQDVYVIALPDLLVMKLSAYRDKDRVHVRAMEAAGLITAAVERGLARELKSRLQRIRETE